MPDNAVVEVIVELPSRSRNKHAERQRWTNHPWLFSARARPYQAEISSLYAEHLRVTGIMPLLQREADLHHLDGF